MDADRIGPCHGHRERWNVGVFCLKLVVKTKKSFSDRCTHFRLREGSGFGVENSHMKFCHGRRKTIARGHSHPSPDYKHLLDKNGPGRMIWEDKKGEGSGSGSVQGGVGARKTRTS